MAAIKVPPGSWLTNLLSSLNVVYDQRFQPHLGDTVVPVYSVNPGDTTLNVANFADEWTNALNAYSGAGFAAGVAGQNSFVMLWNPLTTGRRAFVDVVGNGVASLCYTRMATAAAGAVIAGAPLNKFGGAAASTLELRQGTTAAPGGLGSQNAIVPSLGTLEWKAPIVLPPGNGLVLNVSAVATSLDCFFQWRETAN